MKQQMYPWQKDCLQTWLSHGCRGIVRAVTGSGKTTLAIAAIEKLQLLCGNALKVKIVVPQTALASQWAQALRDNGGLRRDQIGFYYGGRKEKQPRLCMIYVINSARYSLARHILTDMARGDNVFLIADECHHYASEENRKIFEFLPRLSRYPVRYAALGLSATPDTAGFREYLVPALGEEIYRYTFEDAARNQTISPFAICNISLAFNSAELANYASLTDEIGVVKTSLLKKVPSLGKLESKEFFHALKRLAQPKNTSDAADMARTLLYLYYERRNVVHGAEARESALVSLVQRLDRSAKILVFSERINQAEAVFVQLAQIFRGQVGIYHSQQEKMANQTTLNRYRSGEIRILVTCRALDEGLDVPQTSVGIVMSSSTTERQRIQRLGRILRRTAQSELAALYYFYVEGTTDPYTYMSDFEDTPVKTLFLSYITGERGFIHPQYEQLAASVLSRMVLEGAEYDAQLEFRRCAALGQCRTDWLLEEKVMNQRIQHAGSLQQKNYWMCMKMLRREDEAQEKLTW